MEREGEEFVRVVIISDGVDNNPEGLTREELFQHLKEQAIPIHTLGSVDQNNMQNLKELYALSRQTNGLSWTLSELSNTLSAVQTMSGTELPVCVKVKIPKTLQDGSVKEVQLINNDRRVILKLTDRANPGRCFETPLLGRVSIGRNPGNQIVLDYERSVSGTHCEIFVAGNVFKVRDLGSKNGTYVDGIQVGDTAEISSGSILKLGRLELTVDMR